MKEGPAGATGLQCRPQGKEHQDTFKEQKQYRDVGSGGAREGKAHLEILSEDA